MKLLIKGEWGAEVAVSQHLSTASVFQFSASLPVMKLNEDLSFSQQPSLLPNYLFIPSSLSLTSFTCRHSCSRLCHLSSSVGCCRDDSWSRVSEWTDDILSLDAVITIHDSWVNRHDADQDQSRIKDLQLHLRTSKHRKIKDQQW